MKPNVNIQIYNNKNNNYTFIKDNTLRTYSSSSSSSSGEGNNINNSEIIQKDHLKTIKTTISEIESKIDATIIKNNIYTAEDSISIIEKPDIMEITENIEEALKVLVKNKFSTNILKYETIPVSGRGENSYGSVLQFKVFLNNINNTTNSNNNVNNNNSNNKKDVNNNKNNIFYCIAKISPKNEARRQTMKVVDYYQRETYVYKNILTEYENLQMSSDNNFNLQDNIQFIKNLQIKYNHNDNIDDLNKMMMMIAPKLYSSSLQSPNEFLLLEDLHQSGYSRFNRKAILTYDHTVLAIRELAKYHAMSFVLKSKNLQKYTEIIENIRNDNLFSEELSQVSVEFGKKYMKAAIKMLENENQSKSMKNKEKIIKSIRILYDNFKDICIKLVNGKFVEPYAVICHGDFWNNNILYKYDDNNIPISAKVIDFQMVRYGAPVLDLVHYLFTCTGKQLRDKYFDNFKDNYYNQLASTLRNFDLDSNEIYPRLVFENQIQQYGIYGFCMACYALPFFISDSSDLPNLDEASEAIKELSDSSSDDCESEEDKDLKTTALLEEYEMLNERTTPIFKDRMIGVLIDLAKYNMLDNVFLKI